MLYMGIDPGESGAIVMVDSTCKPLGVEKMPETPRELLLLVRGLASGRTRCVLEHVHAMPKQGVSSTFKFGQNFGQIEMALVAAEIPYELVTPARWKRAMGVLTPKGSTATKRKAISRKKAQQLFPGIKVTNVNAEALLLAVYCREKRVRAL